MDCDLFNHFNGLSDSRVERTKHYLLLEILSLVVSATISPECTFAYPEQI